MPAGGIHPRGKLRRTCRPDLKAPPGSRFFREGFSPRARIHHTNHNRMKPILRLVFTFLAVAFAFGARAASADTGELSRARAELLEAYQNGRTDSDNQVKQLREKIAALEYVAANKPSASPEQPRILSVDFPGGPASALFSLVNQDTKSGLNIIGEKADLAIELPPFTIRNADSASLASALDTLVRQRGYTLQGGVRPAPGLSAVFVLRKILPHEIPGGQVSFQSFQLGHYLEHQTVDDIVAAVRTAWELDPANSATALRMKYHPPTGILLVSAPGHGISLVQTVLNQLRKSEGPKTKADPTPAPAKK